VELSIVTSMYYSAPYLKEFYNRIKKSVEKITLDYEIIFVNDGSPDDSLDKAISLYEKDDRVKVIDLSRNFGHHKAMMTGLAHAKGELVFLIDCDLEEEPELVGKFYNKLKNSDADVVYGVQETRKGSFLERINATFFYVLFNMLSSHPLPKNIMTVRLMSDKYVGNLVEHRERETIIAGLWVITGFRQVPFIVKKLDKGSTTYNFSRKISNLVNGITSFSSKPLVLIFYLGSAIVFISSISALYLIVRRVFFGDLLIGWPSLIVSIWLLGGLIMFCLGVIGIYLSKIFMETKQRPYTVIRKIYDKASLNNLQ
jgi:putative glycosyltransferase